MAYQLCTHIQVTALLILKMTSAYFAISQLDLKISTMHLHTYDIDVKVHRCAIKLEGAALLAKLESGDKIALEAK